MNSSRKEYRTYEGKTFVVTGASSGIGEAVSRMLLNFGAHVLAMTGRKPSSILRDQYQNVETFHCNFADFASLETQFNLLAKKQIQLDGIILCHGYGAFGSLEEFSQKEITELINVNLISFILIARKVLPLLKRHKAGDLVMIGSEAGLKGGKKGAVYCAAKFGINGFAQALREESASSNVRISVVNPGMVKTSFFDELDFQPGENRENYLYAEDVAEAVNLILSMPSGSVVDQINLSPQKNVIRNKNR